MTDLNVPTGDGRHLAAKVTGTGTTTTVAVHGWGVTGRIWQPLAERWSAGQLVVPDLCGAGGSAKPERGYGYRDHASDIIALIEHLDAGPVRLLGHSMGGLISQWVAVERPDLLAALTLVSPTPAGGVPLSEEEVAFFESLYDEPNKLIRMMIRKPPAADVLTALVADVANVRREAFIEGFASWRGASFADSLSTIATPTRVLSGELEEPLTPALIQGAVVSLIPGAKYEMLAGVGHYPQIEDPDAFVAALENE